MAGLYIHIPFCKKRCIYCDFYSTTLIEQKKRYVQAVCREMEIRSGYLKEELIDTIYIGGGTPSQLSGEELQLLFSTIFQNFKVKPEAEITVEANPDDLSEDYLKQLKELPINRLSMGVQTFDDRKLKLLNRRHTAQQALDAVHRCHDLGFENISIDLIYGLPGETVEEWEKDLDTAFSLPITHLSSYHLMYEEGTPLWKLRKEHEVKEVEEDQSVLFFEKLITHTREAGFRHYEISNFCKPGYHSRHNSSYWKGIPYLGCGAAAHSYDGESRQWNVADLELYIKGIEKRQLDFEKENLTLEMRYNEYVMTGLRTSEGFSLTHVQNHFGTRFVNYARKMAQSHILQGTLDIEDDRIKLSHQGIFISDGIMSDLMIV